MDDLEVIRRAIEEHHKIRSGLRQVGAAVNDMEALFGLQQAHASWMRYQMQVMVSVHIQ